MGINLNLNPALNALKFNDQVNDHLEQKAQKLLDQMKDISNRYKDVSKILRELNVHIQKDYKGEIDKVDFSENSDIKDILDGLYEMGILPEKKYVFEGNDIEFLKASLDGYASELKNQNQEPMLLLQPLLNLMEMMNKITKSIIESDEKIKETTQRNI
ncbi:MAG: hypothetical protein K1060chlam5_01367 [Candidatus Anoxychlamydiales bacterium]|nr:hypothetical protein [Candidatus Anoxychlamydiales bacterium]